MSGGRVIEATTFFAGSELDVPVDVAGVGGGYVEERVEVKVVLPTVAASCRVRHTTVCAFSATSLLYRDLWCGSETVAKITLVCNEQLYS